ncbi:uncharacterized protein F4807DRAFT_346019 [Annulohypoxylon truncatum]|uniref:uncharacterized protein n=1 Tax=Annulohypoxylon truncatum TaxID=327061 RepID=UPI0020077C25|nr:uncharacterized protein F4807DRAFT_346019 [Annulohypoxylon truncatum]KAI1212688.1 hypothetical protein F4807DRAFT_346019 [Annulohypoxylon truncatum]
MLRQSLRPARLRVLTARSVPAPIACAKLWRPYSDEAKTAIQPGSISEVIHQDHRQIEKYYDKIVNSSDHDVQRRYQNAFVWELARHAIAEELVVYPSIETGLNDGREMADKDRAEHQVAKEQLYTFQNLEPGDRHFIPTLEALMKDLKMHIKEEEEHDLVKLEAALVPSRSRKLAEQFEMTKAFTPTRSHPGAPNKPPFETAVGLLTAPLDKIRDIFRSWPEEYSARPPSGGPSR